MDKKTAQASYYSVYVNQKLFFKEKHWKWILLLQLLGILILFIFPENPYSFSVETLPASPFLIRLFISFIFILNELYFIFLYKKKKLQKESFYIYDFLVFSILIYELIILTFLAVYGNKDISFYLYSLISFSIIVVISFLIGYYFTSKFFFKVLKNKTVEGRNIGKNMGIMALCISLYRAFVPNNIIILLTEGLCFLLFFFFGHLFLADSYKDQIKNM